MGRPDFYEGGYWEIHWIKVGKKKKREVSFLQITLENSFVAGSSSLSCKTWGFKE